jgi:AcrR family transcriptional regulator
MFFTSARDTKERILEAAALQFAARGFRSSTMREIATAAKINEVTIYRYFPAKQELCWSAVDWKMRKANVADSLIASLADIASPEESLHSFCVAALEVMRAEPTLARLLYFTGLELEQERKSVYTAHIKPILTALLIRLRSWIETGEIRCVDPETAAVAILGMLLSQLQLTELVNPPHLAKKSIQKLASEYTDIVLGGIRPTVLMK